MKKKSLLLSLIALVGLAGCDLNLDPVLREDTTKIEQPTDSPEVILQKAKEKAKTEIDEYKDDKDYRDKELGVLWELEDEAKAAIEAANSQEEIDEIIKNFKEKVDALKTNEQYEKEEKEIQESIGKALDSLKQDLSLTYTINLIPEELDPQSASGITVFTSTSFLNEEEGYEPLTLFKDEDGNCITYELDYETNTVVSGYPISYGQEAIIPFAEYSNPFLALENDQFELTEEGISLKDKAVAEEAGYILTLYNYPYESLVLGTDENGLCDTISLKTGRLDLTDGSNIMGTVEVNITVDKRGDEVVGPEIPVPFESEPEQALLQQALLKMNQASSYTETASNEDFFGDEYSAAVQELQYTSDTILIDQIQLDEEYNPTGESVHGYHVNTAGNTKAFTVEDGVVVASDENVSDTVEELHAAFTNEMYAPECWTVTDVDEEGNITFAPQNEYLATELMPSLITDELYQTYAYFALDGEVQITKDCDLVYAAFEYDYGDLASWLGVDSWFGMVIAEYSEVNSTVIDDTLDFSVLEESEEVAKIGDRLVGTWRCESKEEDWWGIPSDIALPAEVVIDSDGTVTLNGTPCEFVSYEDVTKENPSASVTDHLVVNYNGEKISMDLTNEGVFSVWNNSATVYFECVKVA